MSATILKANSQHAPIIAAFNQRMALETESKQLNESTVLAGVSEIIANPEKGFYLAAENADGSVVGCLAITYEWSDWRNGTFWWIQSVFVEPAERGQGVFRALFQEVNHLAQTADNVCGVRLYVERENTSAQATYQKLGMTETAYRIMEVEY